MRRVLTAYLESGKHRKTPERFAILDAVYSMKGHFTLEELSANLATQNFRVSRATLYNTIKLLMQLHLIIRHRLVGGTVYEAGYAIEDHCHQVCTLCGKVSEVQIPTVIDAINSAKLQRFHKDGFALYIYGVCSSCLSKSARKKTKDTKEKI